MKGRSFFLRVVSVIPTGGECMLLLRSQWMKHSREFHNEQAQKTNANSLTKKKRLILKDKPPKLVIIWMFKKRTTCFLILFGGCFDPQNSDRSWFFSKMFQQRGCGWQWVERSDFHQTGFLYSNCLKKSQFHKWLKGNENPKALHQSFTVFKTHPLHRLSDGEPWRGGVAKPFLWKRLLQPRNI